jgi:hypothetical protein
MISKLNTSPVWTYELAVQFSGLREAWYIGADVPVASFWMG